MKRAINLLIATLVMTSLFTACSDDKEETFLHVDAENNTLTFQKEGGTQTLTVSSNSDWGINGLPDWISTNAVSGINEKTVQLTAVPNETGLQRNADFTIRTNDGKNTISVKVIQLGSSKGDYLEVDDTSMKVFGGAIKFHEDSIIVNSSVQWTIEGPSWMQATFNNVRLSLNADVTRSGSGTIYLSVEANTEMENRDGVIRLQSMQDNKTIEIPVLQLGTGSVSPIETVILANGYACGFKYGRDVKWFSYKLFEGDATNSDLEIDKVQDWPYANATSTILFTTDGLKPNTQYTLYMLGIDSDYYFARQFSSYTFITPSDARQPLVAISNAQLGETGWHWTAVPNEYTTGFYSYYPSKSFFGKQNSYVAWHMKREIKKGRLSAKGTSSLNWTYHTQDDVMIATWAMGGINSMLSSLITTLECSTAGAAVKSQKAQTVLSESMDEQQPDGKLGTIIFTQEKPQY